MAGDIRPALRADARQMIGKAVAARRTASRMSLAELGEACGVSSATIFRIERGTTGLSLDTAMALCAALGMTVRQLLAESGQSLEGL